MTDADKLLVRRLFLQIAELPAAARAAALERACQGNARLRTEVEALLRADAEAGQFMASPTADGVARRAPEGSLSSEQPGSSIGRYKLLEQIGEGGMGTIWMAEQREPVKRRVALKIIKLGMDTKQVIARFEAERQALAMMDHPHIAKVFDAGTTDAGRPYFVMEYIKGIPILEYCDQQKVDTKSRLQLFLAVCHAIQHAHQKGVIHRDIKPSNVLVTLHDGVPVCKVIDFGIAKATNSELTTKTLFTEHRQMVGTPAYMSPEQAEMSGLDIDTRSDIYSLGVLLYELLTGTTPFDIKDLLAKGLGEMMRTIREVEPHKPSTRISELGEIGTRTAMERRVDQNKLCSLLRGDLDWIVMKCLEKDRSRRYETANGLAADIRRHLDDEPVTAGAPSASYRLHKFIRRNKVQVLAGAAVAAALLIGVVGFAWQAKLANEQRIVAEKARESESEQRKLADASRNEAETQARIAKEREAEARKSAAEAIAQEAEARKQAAIAEAIARFQTEMLAAADPQNLLGDTVTVVQVMAAAVTLLDAGSLAEQPLAEARVRATIGMTLEGLGRYDDAEPNLRKALAITRAVHPAGHEDITTCVHMLAGVLLAQNNHVEAERLSREALETARAVYPAGHPELASALNLRSMQLLALDKNAEAEPLLREALAIERQVAPDGRQGTDSYLDNLAKVLWNLNQLDEAEALFREALAIRREALPAAHPTIAMGLNNLAALLHHRSKLTEAEPLQREALGIYRACLPAGHPDIAKCLQILAGLLQSQGRYAEADSLAREAVDIDRAAGHPGIAQSLTRLGTLRMTQGKFAEAEPLLHEALAASRAFHPAGHRDIATALGNLAMVLDRQDKYEEAEPVLRESIDLLRASVPADHPHLVATLRFLAHFYERQGKVDQAVPVRRELLGSTRASLEKDSPELAVHLMAFSESLITLQQWGEAEGVLRECLAIREKAEPDAWTTWNTRSWLGAAMLGQKKFAEAEAQLLAGYRGLQEREASIPPAGAIRIPRAIEHLVQLYEATGNATEAAAWRGRLEAARAKVPAPGTTGGR